MKRYILIAGVNGAGKSTLFQSLDYLQCMPRINIDEIVREFGDWKNQNDVAKAGRIAVGLIRDYFKNGLSFNQETTLCGKSILKNIKCAKQLGYKIEPVVLRICSKNNQVGIRKWIYETTCG